ncbi:MAG: preprotein translocase subunit SecY [Lachnospiraceae bacterium]|nr:preprotein translocase subunit SecY [Lachnospiraceae bacterium]
MRYKLAYTGLILFIYTLGRCIPLYGIDTSIRSMKFVSAEDILMQTISGDAYRSSVFALGIFPYMISGILVQIVMVLRNLASKSKISPGKISRATVTVTLGIAILQAFSQMQELSFIVEERLIFMAKILVMTEMVTGVMLMMWMSDRNGKYGIGGRMMLALVNILDRLISTVYGHSIQKLAIPLVISVVMMIMILIMENAEKRIPVQRISIHNIYADKNYMAIKLNPVGIMPVMFSTAVFMLPRLFVSLLGYLFPAHTGIVWWQENMTLTRPLGISVYIACEYLLTIGLSLIMISPKDITEQFLKSGDSIVNLHAGYDTRKYLRTVVWRISFLSASVMGACVGIPLLLQLRGNIDGSLVMLPSSVMMLTGFWCNIRREIITIQKYDTCQPLF